ncbi:Cro/CI family transcriptional regulator [Pseudomonas capsici]|uniref:Cro/CI family transcriptional regulator n=1 Tax=Pseudomonas capsici TaxID=2810614 RepID=UPI0021F1E27E|nr:Cro/CI family transcriptional regulator [Pseudomonas capsici]MCV4287907.1 Cro/CI family transcriptional regulator [Pseudomonas capsici]
MTYDDALKHFGSGKAIGDALGVTRSRVSQCRAAGGFSYPMQCVLEKESEGQLQADRADDPASTQKRSAA